MTKRDKASQLLALADRLGLAREPLPRIDLYDIQLICWTVILAGDLAAP
jgi:hypothetical protein